MIVTSIMRDGTYVGTWSADELTTDLIISKMVGRDMTTRFPPKTYQTSAETIMEVRNLTASDPRSFKDITFDLHKGEILGLGGLVGAQRTELVEAIFGLREDPAPHRHRRLRHLLLRSLKHCCHRPQQNHHPKRCCH